MRNPIRLVVCGIAAVLIWAGCSQESETKTPQEFAFNPQKVWELTKIGDYDLMRPAEPRIADDGRLYLHDFERHLSFILDGDGNLVNSFAPRGDNEGEIPMYLNCFPAGDEVVISSMDRLHFFDDQGNFIKTVMNNPFVRFPLAFKSPDEFWVAPGALGDSPDSLAVITHVNLQTGEETAVHRFTRTEAESKPTRGALVVGITPQIKMAYDRAADKIYFGKNSDTLIYSYDLKNNSLDSFTFAGVVYPVSDQDKREHFAQFGIPEEPLARIVASLPDQMTYYSQIRVLDGLVYLISSKSLPDSKTGADINIYSPDGKHLYYGRIAVEDGWHLSGSDNLQLGDRFVIAVLENDAGDRRIAKYAVEMPAS